ncbi:MAG: GSU2403 family nucleotidyltransferase fold protein [Pseudomonadota bacterium]
MLQRHSSTAHSAYADLRRSLLDERATEIRGTPVRVERNGRRYWYDNYRVGAEVKRRYIGEETEALLETLTRHRALRAERDERRRKRTRLVRLLRNEGYLNVDPATGSLLNALASAGVFRLGGTLVGTNAFRLYEGELGVRMALDDAAMTNDLDIASFERLSLALAADDGVDPKMEDVLGEFQFAPAPSLERGKTWRWRQTRSETFVEFLTPSFDDEEGLRELPALGVSAQSLHFLNYLIAEPIQAVALYRSGVLVQAPRPERYAIQKLIVSERRRDGIDSLKSEKDRRQAAFLIDILAEDRPDELAEALEDARSQGLRGRGAKWREKIDAALKRMPETAAKLAALG